MASSDSLSTSGKNNFIDYFCCVTGADRDKAHKMLEASKFNLVMAISMHDRYNLRSRKRRPYSSFEGFMDFQAEARLQELLAEDSKSLKKRRTLEDQFRPPLDIIYRGNFDSACAFGQTTNRWLMVNIQNSEDLASQVLNRDVWSNPSVKNLIRQHFVFWQVCNNSTDGELYMRYYNPLEFPYISVIDARTGEKLEVWHDVDAAALFELVNVFLKEHNSPNGTTIDIESSSPNKCTLLDKSDQIKSAFGASLKESNLNEEEFSESNDKGDRNIEASWKDYLGAEDDPKTELVLRFPDDKKEQISWPCSTKIKALVLYMEELGYDSDEYDLITNYPRRNLCELDLCKSLKEVDLLSQIIIVEQNS